MVKTITMKLTAILPLALLSFFSLSSQTLTPLTWNIITVKDPQMSCGFIDVSDFDNDGKKEIVFSTLMEQGSASSPWNAKGALRIMKMPAAGIAGTWTEQIVIPTTANLPFINNPQVMDVDNDGQKDILVQQGFLQTNGGSHGWLKGPSFTTNTPFALQTTKGSTYSFWHESEQIDLDGDGLLDIVTTSAQTQDAATTNNSTLATKKANIEFYRNTGGGVFQYYVLNDSLGGVFIKLYDVDKDGDKDIVVSQFFWNTNRPALVWLENVNAPSSSNGYLGNWAYHKIDRTTGLGYYFDFFDVTGDGIDELVYCNHNNQNNTAIKDSNNNVINPGLFYFDIPSNPTTSSQWTKHLIYDGFRVNLYDFGNPASQGSPGIFAHGDIDYNGTVDLVVPGDGNDTLYIFRQQLNHTWQKEIVDNGKMFGHAKITDLDNDGTLEIVAAKHNFPEVFQIFTPPAGFLKIYKPTNVSPTSVSSNHKNSIAISVYPNPSTGEFSVQTNKETVLSLVNELGQIQASLHLKIETNFTTQLNIETPGMYYLIGNGIQQKIVVVK